MYSYSTPACQLLLFFLHLGPPASTEQDKWLNDKDIYLTLFADNIPIKSDNPDFIAHMLHISKNPDE